MRQFLFGLLLLTTMVSATAVMSYALQSYVCEDGFETVLGGDNRVIGDVRAYATFDDGLGAGPLLYAGGSLQSVDGFTAKNLIRWDGIRWSRVQGLLGSVQALFVYDDGSGLALYVGGFLFREGDPAVSGVYKWNGLNFEAVGGGIQGVVTDFEVYDDGNGVALYAAGLFPEADGIPCNNVARWNGTSWTRLGSGTNNRIEALEVYDSGQGPKLYAGGRFSIAGGHPALRIASWDGTHWLPVGAGITSSSIRRVHALQTFDAGFGPRLFVGGNFRLVDGVTASGLAEWDGSSWLVHDFGSVDDVMDFELYDTGSGPRLYATGRVETVIGRRSTARWSGNQWVALANSPFGLFKVGLALGVHDDGAGEVLHVSVDQNNNSAEPRMATWDGGSWEQPGSTGPNERVEALFAYERPGATSLIIGGRFEMIGGVAASGIAEWDGANVMPLGTGLNSLSSFESIVEALASYDDGAGTALYVGGSFSDAGGVPVDGIAKWNGQAWSSLGGVSLGLVKALQVFDDGTGNALYVGGDFTSASGLPTGPVAKWNGSSWSAVGNMPTLLSSDSAAYSFGVFDDGTGLALYVGGVFDTASGAGAFDVLRWNGTAWLPVPGSGPAFDGLVNALVPFDDGSGEALYAVGNFENDPAGIFDVARYDGTAWSRVGTRLQTGFLDDAIVFDDGSGPELFIGGTGIWVDSFSTRLGASWNGLSWEPTSQLQNLPSSTWVHALANYEVAGEERLFIGGRIHTTDIGDSHLTSWKGCSPGDEFCFADSITMPNCAPCPCNNDQFPGYRGGCKHSQGDGARLRSTGEASVASGNLRFQVTGGVSNSIALLISGTAALPANGSCAVGAGIPTTAFDGLRCVGLGILRHGTRITDSSGSVGESTPGWGPPDDPVSGLAAQSGFLVGQARFFQVVYRDDPAQQCGTGLNTTNGVRVVFR